MAKKAGGLELEVHLVGVEPPIQRRGQVPARFTLAKLPPARIR